MSMQVVLKRNHDVNEDGKRQALNVNNSIFLRGQKCRYVILIGNDDNESCI